MSENNNFSVSIKSLLTATSAIEVRIHEIREFEKQWKEIFVSLSPEFGIDVKINIANQLLLHTFRYDKFHVVCDDLLSLIENEYQSEFSVSRAASKNLTIKSLKEFLEYEKSQSYDFTDFDAQTGKESKAELGSDRAMLENIFATERRSSHITEYHNLFGAGKTDEEKWLHLKVKLSNLAKEIKGLRNLFSHKHIQAIQKKYSAKWDDLEIEKVERWFNEFFIIVQKIAFLSDGTYYRGTVTTFPATVSDQIDLILFGTIEHCSTIMVERYPEYSYARARKEFYSSREFVDLVVSKKSQ